MTIHVNGEARQIDNYPRQGQLERRILGILAILSLEDQNASDR